MRAFRRGLAALLCAVTTAALAAVPAVGEQPDPVADGAPAVLQEATPGEGSTVGLLPSVLFTRGTRVTDDALYLLDADAGSLWRWPLMTGSAGTVVGAPTTVVAGAGSYAEHDGSLAYVRVSDGRIVLRSVTGAETTPTWAPPGQHEYGVSALTADWLAGMDSSWKTALWNVHTGARVPLADLSALPGGFGQPLVHEVEISDTRALWVTMAQSATATFTGVFSVALDPTDPDGAVGTVALLDFGLCPLDGVGCMLFSTVGTAGATVAWAREDCSAGCQRSLLWYPTGAYSGSPVRLVSSAQVLGLDGTILATGSASDVAWYDLSGTSTTPVRTIPLGALPADPVAANDRFVISVSRSLDRWLTDATGAPVIARRPPTDMRAGDTFYADVLWLVNAGVTGGYPDGTFRPAAAVSRDAMAAFLYRMSHDGARAPACSTAAFTDVPASSPFCGEIAWLASTGVTTGWADGTFRPGQAVTREAMAAFLYRFSHAGARAPSCASAPFTDVAASHPFCGEIAWMASTGISTGWSDHTFRPSLTIERQAMAAFLHRYGTTYL